MKETRELEGLIIKLQTGEITPEEQQRLQQLVQKYPAYRDLIRTHNLLTGISHLFAEPDAAEFKHLRDSVLQSLETRRHRPSKLMDWIETVRFYLQRPEIAVAALTLLIGFFLGRLLPPESQSNRSFLKQINLTARENKQLKDVQNSPYRYSNISFNEIDSQNIDLSFDVSTHMELVRPKSDPLVREVISQALLNPARSGSELKVIAMSESMLDKKIKEALIFSLHNAPMLAVRMKSLDTLLKYKNDAEVEEACLRVLQQEESVQMRLMVLDHLEEIKFDRPTLKAVLSGMDLRNSPAVLLRANKYIDQQPENNK
jgi:hypothetical protein